MARERAVVEKKWPILFGFGALAAIPVIIWMLKPPAPPLPEGEAEILAFTVSKG